MKKGMTLLEIVFATAILTVIVGVMVTMNISLGSTAAIQQSLAQRNDDAFGAMQEMVNVLHNARWSTLQVAADGQSLTFQVPQDVDGNGLPVDDSCNLELSNPVVIQRDTADINGDGFTNNQLILVANGTVRVLASSLNEGDEIQNADGTFQDDNENGYLDRGVFFERDASVRGIRIDIQTVDEMTRYKRENSSRFIRVNHEEVVRPRN